MTPTTPARQMLLVTLSLQGFGWGLFDPSVTTFSLLPIQSISLYKDERLSDYQLENNVYLQIDYLEMNKTPEALIYHVMLTSVYGEHF